MEFNLTEKFNGANSRLAKAGGAYPPVADEVLYSSRKFSGLCI
jgi:hypothetical protein